VVESWSAPLNSTHRLSFTVHMFRNQEQHEEEEEEEEEEAKATASRFA
jgi:hypothetical protein